MIGPWRGRSSAFTTGDFVTARNRRCSRRRSHAVLINSVEDHAHVLFDLARTVSISQAVEDVKKSSSKWIKTQGPEFAAFAWQAGYGAFAVSESNVETVRHYIAGQREHHRKKSFQEEYRAFLLRHNLTFDERYVWD
jgi:putative transposase